MIWLAYAIGLTPFISMMHFGAGFFDALTTTVKVWPFTYYFSLLGVLCWLRPTARQIERAVLGLGAATFVLMALLWALVPASWYTVDATNSKFFIYLEFERGNRIYMPMFFGYLLLLLSRPATFTRAGIRRTGAVIATGFALLLWINKQRTSIVRARHWSLRWRRAPRDGACWPSSAARSRSDLRRHSPSPGRPGGVVDSLGELAVRAATVLDGRHRSISGTIRCAGSFGVGAPTRFSSVTLADIFKERAVLLADIGWVGVIFEFGVVGALLVAAVYGAA